MDKAMTPEFRSGSEAVLHFGKKILANNFSQVFNLDDAARFSFYQKAYLSFCGGKECEKQGIKPRKGIWVAGHAGVGRSTLMQVMQLMFKDTEARFKRVKTSELKELLRDYTRREVMDMYGKKLKCGLYIDDLDIDNFNNESIIQAILYERSELYVSEGIKTHLNMLVPKSVKSTFQLEEQIDNKALLDRLNQMTNLLFWEGESLRK